MGTKTTIWDFVKIAGLLFLIGCVGVFVAYATYVIVHVMLVAIVIRGIYFIYQTIEEIYLLIVKKIKEGRQDKTTITVTTAENSSREQQ